MISGRIRAMFPALLATLTPTSAFGGADCALEAEGTLLQRSVDEIPRLRDPRCFATATSTSIGIAIIDGSAVLGELRLGSTVKQLVTLQAQVPAVCGRSATEEYVRSFHGFVVATIIKRDAAKGQLYDKRIPAEFYLICARSRARVAISAGTVFRAVVTAEL